MANLAGALDASILGKVTPFADVMAGQQQKQIVQQTALTDQFAKQFQLAGQIIGNSAVDQPSYDKARAYAQSQGVDTGFLPDQFNPDVIDHLRFAGATPTAQLSAMIADQGHRLKAGIAGGGDIGAYGYKPSNTAPTNAPIVSTPPTQNKSMTPPEQNQAINDLYGDNTDNSLPAQPVVLTGDNGQPVNDTPPTEPPIVAPPKILAPPVKRPNQTVQDFRAELEQWKTDPTNASFLEENKTGGAKTITDSDKLDADAKAAQNMLYSLSTLKDAASQFKAGAAAPAKVSLMRIARAVGYPLDQSQVDSLSNMQAFTKVANDIVGQAAKAEGGASRLLAAFNTIKAANPNIGLEPETLDILFDKMGAQANNIIDEQQGWNTQKTQNPALNFTNFERGYVSNQSTKQRQMGGKLPSTQDTLPQGVPPGSTVFGTSKGKPVYKTPDGQFLMEQ